MFTLLFVLFSMDCRLSAVVVFSVGVVASNVSGGGVVLVSIGVADNVTLIDAVVVADVFIDGVCAFNGVCIVVGVISIAGGIAELLLMLRDVKKFVLW